MHFLHIPSISQQRTSTIQSWHLEYSLISQAKGSIVQDCPCFPMPRNVTCMKKVIEKFLEDEEVEMLERSRHSYLVCRHLKQWLNHYWRPTLSTWFSSWKTKSCIRINTWSSDLHIDLYFIPNVIESDYPRVEDPPSKGGNGRIVSEQSYSGSDCKLLQGKMLEEKKGFLVEEMLLEVVWGMALHLPWNTVKRVADFMINLYIYVPVI